MEKVTSLRGDQPRYTQKDLARSEAPASLQYRVTAIRSMGNDRGARRLSRD
jgi:hypothetical protein